MISFIFHNYYGHFPQLYAQNDIKKQLPKFIYKYLNYLIKQTVNNDSQQLIPINLVDNKINYHTNRMDQTTFSDNSFFVNAKELIIYQFIANKIILYLRKYKEKDKMTQVNNHIQQLMQTVINSKQSLFVIAEYLSFDDLKALHAAINQTQAILICKEIDNLITAMLFVKQYVNKVDRTMAYFMHENLFVREVDNYSLLYIAQNSIPQVNEIMNSYDHLFVSLRNSCNMSSEQVNSLIRIIAEPELPLPSAIRSQVGRFCCSSFQSFLCSKVTKSTPFFIPESQFQQFKTYILDNQDNYLIDILSSNQHHETQPFSLVQKIKELFHNPKVFIEKLSRDTEYLTEKNGVFNFFIIMAKLAKNMVASIKLRLKSVSYDPYVYFTELMLRYSLYKFSMLQFEESFGTIFTSFESIVRQTLSISKSKHETNELSLWKVMMSIFASQLQEQIRTAIPTYINLAHKSKIVENNEIYQRLKNLQKQQNLSQYFEMHEGSQVLEYLMDEDNVDNTQVYLTDFVEMLIDISVEQNTVLLCGHSEQFLGGLYQQLEDSFRSYESEILQQFTSLPNIDQNEEKQLIEQEIQFISKKLNMKPRAIRQLLEQLNTDKITLDFSLTDRQLIEVNRRYFGESYELRNSQKSHKSSLTAQDSEKEEAYEMDLQGLEYFSQIDEEQTLQLVDF